MNHIAGVSPPVNSHSASPTKKFSVVVRKTVPGKPSEVLTFQGREAWALRELVNAGERGCTPIDNPAPRWSHYIWCLRDTFNIETVDEPHGGPFPGTHARYVLRDDLTIIEEAGIANAA